MIDIMKTDISLENSDLLIKGVTQTIENEMKKQREGFCGTVCYKIHWVLVYQELFQLVKVLLELIKDHIEHVKMFCYFILYLILKFKDKNEPRFNGFYSRDNDRL